MSQVKGRDNPGGRGKKLELDYTLLDSLLRIQCTLNECASVMGINSDSIYQTIVRDKGMTFERYREIHAGHGKASLRRTMFQMAIEEKNPTMCIFLSKQYLGFAEKIIQKPVETDEEKERLIREYAEIQERAKSLQ